jgi:hypothetical protein
LSASCLFFALVNFIFIQSPLSFNSFTFYVTAIVLLISAMIYLYHLLINLPQEKVQTLPMLWIAFGTIAYYSGTMFIFLFNNLLVQHFPQTHQRLWVLHNSLGVLKNLFFFIALWVSFRNRVLRS